MRTFTLDHSQMEIIHSAYTGCSSPPKGPYNPLEAVAELEHIAKWFTRRGYEVIRYSETAIEVTTPESAALIGDAEGLYVVKHVLIPAWECGVCGELIPIGEDCNCGSLDDERGEL